MQFQPTLSRWWWHKRSVINSNIIKPRSGRWQANYTLLRLGGWHKYWRDIGTSIGKWQDPEGMPKVVLQDEGTSVCGSPAVSIGSFGDHTEGEFG